MRSAAAHMIPNTPRYVSPKEQAENRARLMRYGRRRDPGHRRADDVRLQRLGVGLAARHRRQPGRHPRLAVADQDGDGVVAG